MSEMVDRVVKAMGLQPGPIATNKARKVLEAIREPTEAMLEAAAETPGMKAAGGAMELHQARGYGFAEGSFDAGSPLHQAWRAMIDKALS